MQELSLESTSPPNARALPLPGPLLSREKILREGVRHPGTAPHLAMGKTCHSEQDMNLHRESLLDFKSNTFTPEPSLPVIQVVTNRHTPLCLR